MTRRVVEKLYTKKVCVDFLAPYSMIYMAFRANSLGRQKVGYETVVHGIAKFQALNFAISGPEISERFSF